jgi:UDP-N-acetylglucosamine 4,6-dehydratase
MTLKGNIILTGGAGFLGRAIVRRALTEKWDCAFSVLSRDPEKHHKMQREFPSVRYVVGDVCDLNGLTKAFVGHDIVVHAAAQKHISDGETNAEETMRVNYLGSVNVAHAALGAQIDKVVGISTDKACHPVNVYGLSKLAMERIFQEYDRKGLTQFHQTRYGNILQSTGSVLTIWKQMLERDGYVTATDPDMTRFWMTVEQAVDAVIASLDEPHGTITIPECKALDMRTFAEWTMPGVEFRYNGLRPGEKRYEELVTKEESQFLEIAESDYYFRLHPVSGKAKGVLMTGYRSDNCERLARDELLEMLK